MTKRELISDVAKVANIKKTEAENMVNFFSNFFFQEIAEKGKVLIPSVGTLEVQERAPRVYRHPQTGKKIKTKAKNAVSFKASNKLKEFINK